MMKAKTLGKLLAMMLVTVLVVAMVPTAAFAVEYSITFDPNGGTADYTSAVTADGKLAALPGATNGTKQFDGWFDGSNQVTTGYVFTADTTVVAQWTDTYTVSYVTNGGSSVESTVGVLALPSPLPTPSKSGSSFGGWFTDAGLTSAASAGAAIAADTVLYAKWETAYTVSYESNGGSAVAAATDVLALPSPLPTPSKSGFSFAGWYTDSALTTAANAGDAISADTTLYAKWSGDVYTITFDANGGSTSATTLAADATTKTLSSLPTATREGKNFGGWFTDPTNGTKISTATVFTADTTVYAHWSSHVHNAVYVAAKNPTTEAYGNIGYYYCADCNKAFRDSDLKEEITLADTLIAPLTKFQFTKGAGSTYSKSAGGDLSFTTAGTVTRLYYVAVDGNVVDPAYYSLASGSTVITLKSAYLKTLTNGQHTLTVVYDDNAGNIEGSAQTYFIVKGTGSTTSSSVKTSDDSNMILWVSLAVVSACGMGVTAAYGIKYAAGKKKSSK